MGSEMCIRDSGGGAGQNPPPNGVARSACATARPWTFCFADKVSSRHANAHAHLNALIALRIMVDGGTGGGKAGSVTAAQGALGGLVSTGTWTIPPVVFAPILGAKLGEPAATRAFVSVLTAAAAAAVDADMGSASANSHLAPREQRVRLAAAFAYKAVLGALHEAGGGAIAPRLVSAVADSLGAADDRPVSSGVQAIGVSDSSLEPISLPMPKLSSLLQVLYWVGKIRDRTTFDIGRATLGQGLK